LALDFIYQQASHGTILPDLLIRKDDADVLQLESATEPLRATRLSIQPGGIFNDCRRLTGQFVHEGR
jgi:hypothetical protein